MDRLDRMILTILQEDATVPVAEIGRRVGLLDASHFVRLFRQHTGLTPGTSRRACPG